MPTQTLKFTITKIVAKSYVTRRRVAGRSLRQKKPATMKTINDIWPAQESRQKIRALVQGDDPYEIVLHIEGTLPLKLRDELTLSFEA